MYAPAGVDGALSQRARARHQLIPAARRQPAARRLQTLLAAALALLTGACDGPPITALDDYLGRVARPLDVSAPKPDRPRAAMPPRWESLQIPIAGDSLDGLDFLRLNDCALQQTIARRNSSLGRLAPPSQRLLLALDFLQHAPDCSALLEARGRDELAGILRDATASKRRQLPALLFNATLGGAEYRDFWRGDRLRPSYPETTNSAIVTDLDAINSAATRWLAGDYSNDPQTFELHLSGVSAGDGGELLQALTLQAAYIDAASALLDARAAQGPLCRGGLQPRAATILRNVARRFFVTGIQRRAAALSSRQHALLPALRELESLLADALPPDYLDWREIRDARLAHGAGAPKRHVRSLQRLLGSCFEEFAPARN